MKAKQYDLPIDIKEGLMFSEKITLVTGDEGANIFVVRLFEDSAAPYDIAGAVVRLVVKTPSGSTVQETLSMQNAAQGQAAKSLATDCFCEIGEHIAEVQVWEGNLSVKRLTTPQFKYMVRSSLQNDATVEAQTKFSLLQELIEGLADQNNPHNVTAAQVGASNPNLLINGDFQVWQRGTSSLSGGYTADRWKLAIGNGTVSRIVAEDLAGAKVCLQVMVGTADWSYFYQPIENHESLIGKIVTLSGYCKPVGGIDRIYFNVGYANTKNIASMLLTDGEWSYFSRTVRFTQEMDNIGAFFTAPYQSTLGQGYQLALVKLELGEVATHFVPRSYGEELAECQRYCLPIVNAMGMYGSTNADARYVYCAVPLCTVLRCTPTIDDSIYGNFRIRYNGGLYTPTECAIYGLYSNQALLRLSVSELGLAKHMPVFVYYAGGTTYLDAEIY